MSLETMSAPIRPGALLTPEQVTTEIAAMETQFRSDLKFSGEVARYERLSALEATGFDAVQKAELVNQMVAIGFPVDNIASLHRKPNTFGRENTLGSWGIGSVNYGEFSVYELLDRQVPEQRLGTVAHENAHATTPLNPNNAYMFGGEIEREKAEQFITQAADQALNTNTWLNPYHEKLGERLAIKEIDLDTFREETWAILSQLALTNRQKIVQVEQAQHASIDRRIRGGLLPEGTPKLRLITPASAGADAKPVGIDGLLTNVLDGVSNYPEFMNRVATLKSYFYPKESLEVARARWLLAQEYARAAYIAHQQEIERQLFRLAIQDESEEEEEDGTGSSSKKKAA